MFSFFQLCHKTHTPALEVKGKVYRTLVLLLPNMSAMLMSPNKANPLWLSALLVQCTEILQSPILRGFYRVFIDPGCAIYRDFTDPGCAVL